MGCLEKRVDLKLRDEYELVKSAETADGYRAALVAFAEHMEFSTISAVLVIDRMQSAPTFISTDNAPEEFAQSYADEADSRRDPVLRRLKQVDSPVIWDQDTYVEDNAGDLWEQQAPYGYRTGIAMAMHLPNGRHFLLGVDRAQALPDDADRLTRMMADLQLLAVCAQSAARRLFQDGSGGREREPVDLTAREREVLFWTLKGKKAWSIAQILEVSEHTVHWHVKRAIAKLGCADKYAAAMRARDLDLI